MKAYSLVMPIAVRSRPLGLADWRLWFFSALFALGNLLVPLALHAVPNASPVFLPLFFFTLVAAWQFGLAAGLTVALASPLLNHFLTGMPVAAMLLPVLGKSVALALAAVLLARATRAVSLPGLLLAVAAMQAAGFAVSLTAGMPAAKALDLVLVSWPGMLAMVVGGYVLLRLINHLLSAGEK